MDEVLVQVVIGLLVYTATVTVVAKSTPALSGDAARWIAAAAAFVFIVLSTLLATSTNQIVLAAIGGYLAVGLMNRAIQDPPGRRLDRYFRPGAASLFEGVKLPASVNTLVLARGAWAARSQGTFAAASLRTSLYLRRNPTGEIEYDLKKTYVYNVREATEVHLRLRLTPRFPEVPSNSAPVVKSAPRVDPERDKWTIAYWPISEEQVWARASKTLSATVVLGRSRDPSYSSPVTLDRAESFDSPGGTMKRLEFEGRVILTAKTDTINVQLNGVPHMPDFHPLHFYAWEICEGSWDFRAQIDQSLSDEHAVVSAYAITGAQIPVEIEHARDHVEVRYRPGDLVLLPEDAVVVTLRRDSTKPKPHTP